MHTAASQDVVIPRTGDYDQLAEQGHYSDSPQGLWGKYDNVRRYWENQITRFIAAPAVKRARRQAAAAGRGARILDLGCGSGEGWELLTGARASEPGARLFAPDDVACYHGVDLSPAMIASARSRFATTSRASFAVGDLTEPAAFLGEEYDLYFNSYGSLSHLDDTQLSDLLTAIATRQRKPCSIVVDVHGQFSPEWPDYWGCTRDPGAPRMRPYDMTWLYPPAEAAMHRHEFTGYRIRYWGGSELEQFLRQVPGLCDRLASVRLFDRSIAVGRHLDTGVFNPQARPVRRAVNRLFEFNDHPGVGDLRLPTLPTAADATIASFHHDFALTWNACVDWFVSLCTAGPDAALGRSLAERLPPALQLGMEAITASALGLGWLKPGAPVANIIQPQFALFLRQVEFHLQRGLGCGHGLIAVLDLGEGE
jgi:SAM-dependent methyltransferase